MASRNKRSYTKKERSKALVLAEKVGAAEASKTLKIPVSTIRTWRSLYVEAKPAPKKVSTKRRQFSKEEQDVALEMAGTIGVKAACAKLGMATATLYSWRARAQASEGVVEEPASSSPSEEVVPEVPQERRVGRKYTPSEKARALEYMAEHGVSATARKFGMSRFSLHDWRKKVERAARGEGDSPTSGPDPNDIEAQRNAEILATWKKHQGLGPSQIRNQLRRQGVKVSVKTVRDVMIDAGYRPPNSKRVPHDERFESVRPNHMWHLDFVQRFINRCSVFTLIIIDDHSRFVVGHCAVESERADPMVRCFEEAVRRYGRPEMVLHDKGSAFWSWNGVSRFTRVLTEMGIDQIAAQFKEWNGKLECFNANIQKEFFNVNKFYDVSSMRRQLNSHLHWYNHQRTHHSLGGIMVPADRYYGREEEARALMAAGAGNMLDLHTLNLGDRPMDIFRVVQRGAETQIWLMGQKLMALVK